MSTLAWGQKTFGPNNTPTIYGSPRLLSAAANEFDPIKTFAHGQDLLSGTTFVPSVGVGCSQRQTLFHRRTHNDDGPHRHSLPASASFLPASQSSMDCEMVGVGIGGHESIVTFVDWDGRVVLDEYVKPTQPVYRTQVSNVTQQHFASCQAMVKRVIQDKVVMATRWTTASRFWICTNRRRSYVTRPHFYHSCAVEAAAREVRKLRDLALEHLDRAIQSGGHDSVENAIAALDLYKRERRSWDGPWAWERLLLTTTARL